MDELEVTCHKDGSISYYSGLGHGWCNRTLSVEHREVSTWTPKSRKRLERHMKKHKWTSGRSRSSASHALGG